MNKYTGEKWFFHVPKYRKENQLLNLEHTC